jgi:hypothetical protein
MPLTQLSSDRQTLPQLPQLLASVFVLTQVPLQQVPAPPPVRVQLPPELGWQVPFVQVWQVAQVPHLIVPPQPSGAAPQVCPVGHVVLGVQPQTLGVPPPPQVWGAVQVPQLSVPPHPFAMLPQFLCWAAQVVGVQQVLLLVQI